MTFVLGMITGALVLIVCCCAVLSGNLSREEEQRVPDRRERSGAGKRGKYE